MKKAISSFLALAFVFLLGGCSSKGESADNHASIKDGDTKSDEYTYGYDFGSDGSLYYLTTRDTGEVEVFPALKEGEEDIVNHINEAVLHITDENGSEIKSYAFDDRYLGQTLEYDSDCIYFTLTDYSLNNRMIATLKKYTFGDSSSELIQNFEELESIKKTALIDGILYILGIDPANIGKNENTDDFYINSGEKILAYNLSDKTVSTVMEEGAVEMSETSKGTVMIYAHDLNGYYFTEYDPKNGFSEKQYSDLGALHSFAICGENRFIYSNVNTNASIASFDGSGKADLMFENLIVGNIKCSDNGKMCYLESVTADSFESDYVSVLKTVDISEFLNIDLNLKLTMVSAEYIADSPSSMGYSIAQEQVDYDSFALTVLSQDPQYDMYLLYSRSNFAENIKSKGSFYPLNEVEGVREYIDSCFPGIKSAATNEEGDIWMIPVAVSVPALAYSDKVSGDISDLTTEKLISLINEMYNDKEKADGLGQFNAYFVSELMMSNYLFGNTDLDTDEFRSIAKMLKEEVFESKAFSEISSGMQNAMLTGDYTDISLAMAYSSDEHRFISSSGLSVTDFPMPTENPVPSTCAFICVNPASKNLEQTLSYISALTKSLAEDRESLMCENSPAFTENEYYKALKEVYKNTDVRFSYSGEIIMNDFYAYLEGKMTLDNFIKEANRKLSAYLNE